MTVANEVQLAPTRRLCRIFSQWCFEDGEDLAGWNWLFIGESTMGKEMDVDKLEITLSREEWGEILTALQNRVEAVVIADPNQLATETDAFKVAEKVREALV